MWQMPFAWPAIHGHCIGKSKTSEISVEARERSKVMIIDAEHFLSELMDDLQACGNQCLGKNHHAEMQLVQSD
jgi:hypothetical protein